MTHGRTHHESASFGAAGGSSVLDDVDELLVRCLEELAACGPMRELAELRALLPDSNRQTRRFALVELIKFDMAMAAEVGIARRIEEYADAMADLLPLDDIPLDLVLEEIQLRKEAGERPLHGEYAQRFNHLEGKLDFLSTEGEATSAGKSVGPPPELAIGHVLDDFLLIQKLGQGAFAHVYLAQQLSMRRLVALKISRGKGDEPQALAQFDHPNIVRVYDQRQIEEPKAHLLYMQFHPGGTLADVVKASRSKTGERTGALLLECVDQNLLAASQVVPDRSSVRDWVATASWPVVVAWIGIQLARALNDAHEHGVLHRDVKPANVLLSAEGIPKLADFNVSFAGAAGRAGAAATFGGSIGYMSPEHLRAIMARGGTATASVQEPADLYSLAVLLWELWQGYRPFMVEGGAVSWSDAIDQQLASRQQALKPPKIVRGSMMNASTIASERVLENTLRAALSNDPNQRPASGAEMAGRMRLALHPEAATLFDPEEDMLRARVARLSPWIIACTVILIPNMFGGLFNYQYNFNEVMGPATDPRTAMFQASLVKISWVVNLTFFPVASLLVIWLTRSVVRAVRLVRQDVAVEASDISDMLELGHRSAIIGGTFWLVAGVVFPAVLSAMHDDFSANQSMHLFLSSLICGGVAMIYPFFGMALVSSLVYYPQFLRLTMQDAEFDQRARCMIQRSEIYLLIAAIIPLLGAAILVGSAASSRVFMLIAIAAGILGLLASAFAYRIVTRTWGRLAEVLSTQTVAVPGEG